MRYAAELLSDPTRQIKDVSAHCGYPDAAQFSRIFRKQLGIAPKFYRTALLLDDAH